MKRFRYAVDPLCLAAVALYLLNRFVVKPRAGAGFLHDHFDDLLLLPAALPPVLGVNRWCGWRRHDGPPTATELTLHGALWSLICEGLGPRLTGRGTADWRDVVAYAAGGLIAWWWWRRPALFPTRAR